MTFQSTIASIQNIRKQRQLELELVELDRKWHVELKVIARERLGLLKDLVRINREMRQVDHFHDGMHGKDLARFTDQAHDRLQHTRDSKLLNKFNFKPDPVEKMNVHLLPLIREEGPDSVNEGVDLGRVITAKDLNKHRVQLQKTNSEQCTADRRSRRRPFWDKAVIGSRKKQLEKEKNGFFRNRGTVVGPSLVVPQTNDVEEGPRKPRGLSKSPSLPALNNLRRMNSVKVNAVHPSLSNRHSASMDYLPVIRGTRGQHGLFTSSKLSSVSSTTLPTITEA